MNTLDFKGWLAEAAQDEPYAFRAVFTAGGPGSGKSYIAQKMFAGLGFKFADSDRILEMLSKNRNVPLTALDGTPERQSYLGLMNHSMKANVKRVSLWQDLGLPLVIDITGRSFDLVRKINTDLREIGYDTGMLYVSTSLDIARQRNQRRERQVSDAFLVQAHQDAEKNRVFYKNMFGKRFEVIRNDTDYDSGTIQSRIVPDLHRTAIRLLGQPFTVENPLGREKMRGTPASVA